MTPFKVETPEVQHTVGAVNRVIVDSEDGRRLIVSVKKNLFAPTVPKPQNPRSTYQEDPNLIESIPPPPSGEYHAQNPRSTYQEDPNMPPPPSVEYHVHRSYLDVPRSTFPEDPNIISVECDVHRSPSLETSV